VLLEWSTALPNESSGPSGLTIDSDERLYITDGGRVKIFASNGDLIDLISVPLRYLTGLELDGDKILFVATAFPERVMKFVYTSVPVNPTTWGGVKVQFQLDKRPLR
jgi:sugar lactone lactonase YvrE